MSEIIDDILDLKYQVDKTKPLVEENKHLAAKHPDNFALQFAALVNNYTLENKIQKLEKLQSYARCEIFEYRLTGDEIAYGSAPMEIVGEFLSLCQKTINRIAQNIEEKMPTPHIPKVISNEVTLNVRAFAPGSFKIICSATRPDNGLFNGEKELAKDNLLVKSSKKMFNIMEAIGDEKRLLEEIEPLHPYTISAITDFCKVAGRAGINIDATWEGIDNKIVRSLEKKKLLAAYELLDKFDKEPKYDENSYIGKFMSINMARKYFDFQTDAKTIKVYFDDDKCQE